ncbi:hypothetical protein T484DRAFT_3298148 [Baffinella frigidus]|nr:hypothetical protein T484DRAFT_3298148 [Cryptophyta sp. CCMP2293]
MSSKGPKGKGSKLSLSQAKPKGPKKDKLKETDEKQKSISSFFSASQKPAGGNLPKEPPSRASSSEPARVPLASSGGGTHTRETKSPTLSSQSSKGSEDSKGSALPALNTNSAPSWTKPRPPLSSSSVNSSRSSLDTSAIPSALSSSVRPTPDPPSSDPSGARVAPGGAKIGSKRARELVQSSVVSNAGVTGSPHARARSSFDGTSWEESPASRPPLSGGRGFVTPLTLRRGAHASPSRHASFGVDEDDAEMTLSQDVYGLLAGEDEAGDDEGIKRPRSLSSSHPGGSVSSARASFSPRIAPGSGLAGGVGMGGVRGIGIGGGVGAERCNKLPRPPVRSALVGAAAAAGAVGGVARSGSAFKIRDSTAVRQMREKLERIVHDKAAAGRTAVPAPEEEVAPPQVDDLLASLAPADRPLSQRPAPARVIGHAGATLADSAPAMHVDLMDEGHDT